MILIRVVEEFRANKAKMEKAENIKEKHFVLVHGACLGAWSWYKVAAQLKSGGHKVTALDMAACGINPKRLEDVHSLVDYSEPLLEFMEALPNDEKVILVSHSHGGGCASLAMEKFPKKITVSVFLASFMPCLGIDMVDIYKKYKRSPDFFMDCKIVYGEDNKVISLLFGPHLMSTRLFQLCPPEGNSNLIEDVEALCVISAFMKRCHKDLELALTLIRPQHVDEGYLDSDPKALTKENYGSVPRVYIKLEEDNMINKPIEKFRLENYPPEELKIIHNADHMAMLSNPNDLSSYLLEIYEKYDLYSD